MDERLREILGPPRRLIPAGQDAWQEIEDWASRPLPEDYKEFVDGYGDCRIMEFLAISHPRGSQPLLECMKSDRQVLEEFQDWYRDASGKLPFDASTALGWASFDYDGDSCFLLPRDDAEWAVMVAFRQYPMVAIAEGGFTQFMIDLLSGTKVPRGWPMIGPFWQSIKDSPLI